MADELPSRIVAVLAIEGIKTSLPDRAKDVECENRGGTDATRHQTETWRTARGVETEAPAHAAWWPRAIGSRDVHAPDLHAAKMVMSIQGAAWRSPAGAGRAAADRDCGAAGGGGELQPRPYAAGRRDACS